jgi:hypothetical protein
MPTPNTHNLGWLVNGRYPLRIIGELLAIPGVVSKLLAPAS